MTDIEQSQPPAWFQETFSHYAPTLLAQIAKDLGKLVNSKSRLLADQKILKILTDEKSAEPIMKSLSPNLQASLWALSQFGSMPVRWDHAFRLIEVYGDVNAHKVLRTLLDYGIIALQPEPNTSEVTLLSSRDDGTNNLHPYVRVPAELAPIFARDLALKIPIQSYVADSSFRQADGWEVPIRLGVVWQQARLSPLKRTQTGTLFKRDYERISEHPVMNAGMVDGRAELQQQAALFYGLAKQQGWLTGTQDQLFPAKRLDEVWPTDLFALRRSLAQAYYQQDDWCELPELISAGYSSTMLASGRYAVHAALSQLPPGEGTTSDQLAQFLVNKLQPWNQENEWFAGKKDPAHRLDLLKQWVKNFCFGLAYQLGITEISTANDPNDQRIGKIDIVRLTEFGRQLGDTGMSAVEPETTVQTLLVQPNMSLVVYRQGLDVPLLGKLAAFAEFESAGAALMLKLNPQSVYAGLEAGLSAQSIADLLQTRQGRPLAPSVISSLENWSRKRDRVAVYINANLFEFSSHDDARSALDRGQPGELITDRILLTPAGQEGDLSNLRITASRDYRLPPEPCLTPRADGVTFDVNLEKSDLMLEPELRRFMDLVEVSAADNRAVFRITPSSIASALREGSSLAGFNEWFLQRAGSIAPESVRLLFHAAQGFPLKVEQLQVLSVPNEEILSGLVQHPWTQMLITERLGPRHFCIKENSLAEFIEILRRLGMNDLASMLADPEEPKQSA